MRQPARLNIGRWIVVVLCVLALSLLYGAYYTYAWLPKVYKAKSQIQVLTTAVNAEAQVRLLLSPEVTRPIVTDLQLDRIWASRVYQSSLEQIPMQDSLAYLDRITHVVVVPGTNIISITVASEVPKEAADISNAFVDRYKVVRETEIDDAQAGTENVLKAQIAEQQKAVDEKKNAVDAMRTKLAGGTSEVAAADAAAFREMEQQLTTQQGVLDSLGVQMRQLIADHKVAERPVRIISRAEPPEYPSLPDHTTNLCYAAGEGLVLGLIVASLLEWFLWYLADTKSYKKPTSDPRGERNPSLQY